MNFNVVCFCDEAIFFREETYVSTVFLMKSFLKTLTK